MKIKREYNMGLVQDIIRIEYTIDLLEKVMDTYKDIGTEYYFIPIGISSAKSNLKKVLYQLKHVLDYENGKNRNT
jgi:hypothetical protein